MRAKEIDVTAAVVAVVEMREQLIEEMEKALDLRQCRNAARALQALRGFDLLAERLGLLDDREWERKELGEKIADALSVLPWEV